MCALARAATDFHDDPPVTNPDVGAISAGGRVMLDVLANDYDPDGHPLELPNSYDAGDCSIHIQTNVDQTVLIEALDDFSAPCSFTYYARSTNLVSQPTTVQLYEIAKVFTALVFDENNIPYAHQSQLRFNPVSAGDPSPQRVLNVYNHTASDLNIAFDLAGLSPAFDWASTDASAPDYSVVLAPEGSAVFNINLDTASPGEFSGVLKFSHDALLFPTPYEINLHAIVEEAVCEREAFTNVSVPGVIQVEHYDRNLGGSGQDCAYIDFTTGNIAAEPRFRIDEDVDARQFGNGVIAVTELQNGEQLRYGIDHLSAGLYRIEVRYSSNSNNEQPLQLELLLGEAGSQGQWSFVLPTTNSGNSSVFTREVMHEQLIDSAGPTELTINIGPGSANVDAVEFVQVVEAADFPQAEADSIVVNPDRVGQDNAIDITKAFLLSNDNYPTGWQHPIAQIVLENAPAYVTLSEDGHAVTVQDINWSGNREVFQYRVTVGALVSDPVWVSVNADRSAQVVVAQDDEMNVPAQLRPPLNGNAPIGTFGFGRLAMITNDHSDNNSSLQVHFCALNTNCETEQGGTVSRDSDSVGAFLYTPSSSGGTDRIQYTVSDGFGEDTAEVEFHVYPVPVAYGDGPFQLYNGTPFYIHVDELLSNDFVAFQPASLDVESLTLNGPGVVTFDEDAEHVVITAQSGALSELRYRVNDGLGQQSLEATVSLLVQGRPPVVPTLTETILTAVETEVSYLLDPIAHATDPDSDPLTLLNVNGARLGAVAIEDNKIRYNVPAGISGTEELRIQVSDGEFVVDATMFINLQLVRPPEANPDSLRISGANRPIALVFDHLLRNDNGESLRIAHVDSLDPNIQEITVRPVLGYIEIRLRPGYSGPIQFTYSVVDAVGQSSSPADVSVLIF